MKNLQNKIKSLAENYFKDTVEIRRHLHTYPELSFKEYKTSEYIQQKLTGYGIPFTSGLVETGVVGLIKGKNPNSKCIALRADIDALPIQELNDSDYTSKNKGVMHACGHDVHTASLLGVGRILNELKEEWEGTIKLIFQPGEEKLPGGASLMIAEGVLENPKVDKIIGQHVSPELESGVIGMRSGMFMASADEIYIDVIGKGGHAACLRDPGSGFAKLLEVGPLVTAMPRREPPFIADSASRKCGRLAWWLHVTIRGGLIACGHAVLRAHAVVGAL